MRLIQKFCKILQLVLGEKTTLTIKKYKGDENEKENQQKNYQ